MLGGKNQYRIKNDQFAITIQDYIKISKCKKQGFLILDSLVHRVDKVHLVKKLHKGVDAFLW